MVGLGYYLDVNVNRVDVNVKPVCLTVQPDGNNLFEAVLQSGAHIPGTLWARLVETPVNIADDD